MPELPEVEACRRQLQRWGEGRRLVGVSLPDPGAVRPARSTRPSAGGAGAALQALVGATLGVPRRHGKRIAWPVGGHGLLLHLGMTGRWVRRTDGQVPRFGRLALHLDDGSRLWLVDPRRFGCVVPLEATGLDVALHEGLGPDALDAQLDGPALAARLRSRRAVKVALMDQARVAGLGNIQVVEALFEARIHPDTPCEALDPAAWTRLAAAVRHTLASTLAAIGNEDLVYVSEGGENPFSVYGRAGQPCPRCGTILVAASRAGRTTTWCPSCQPAS